MLCYFDGALWVLEFVTTHSYEMLLQMDGGSLDETFHFNTDPRCLGNWHYAFCTHSLEWWYCCRLDLWRWRGIQRPAPKPYKLFPERPLELGTGRAIKGDPKENSFLDGMIDDVIIWGRALSRNEVAELVQGNRPNLSNRIFAVRAEGKLTTTWGKVKSYHHR